MADCDVEPQRKRMSCGLEYNILHMCTEEQINGAHTAFHFVVFPFVHPRYRRELISGKAKDRRESLSRSDLLLTSQDWNRLIVGKFSPYLEVDSDIDHVRKHSEAVFLQEIDFVNHLTLPAILLKLKSGNNLNLAKIINSKLNAGSTFQVWMEVPMVNRQNSPTDVEDTWEWWNKFRSYCEYDKRVGLALEVPSKLPDKNEIDRWLGEPVKCLIINTNLFLTNTRHCPVFTKSHQDLIKLFMELDVQYIIRGNCRHSSFALYSQYLQFLGKKLYERNEFTEYIQGCEDFLQNPLQPLAENLETLVYEVFEKDPHKYNRYQLAIQKAVEDKVALMPHNRELVVMIVGAGRGPLVRATLNVAELTGVQLKVYALEKNPFAVNTLYALQREIWQDKVIVVAGDMRNCDPGLKADIIISELLGSFGDNELSPECLDGAQRFLKDDGISIPVSYTSWLAPIQSLKLFNEIRSTRPPDKTLQSCFETPYVVHIVNHYRIDNTKELFTFIHPNKDEIIDNRRFGTAKFSSKQNCVLTGFAGYFTCELYKEITISTEPRTCTKNMMSWFPIFFPLSEPIQIKGGDTIEVAFWRCVSDTKVWYEWAVVQPKTGSINNSNGRSYTISK